MDNILDAYMRLLGMQPRVAPGQESWWKTFNPKTRDDDERPPEWYPGGGRLTPSQVQASSGGSWTDRVPSQPGGYASSRPQGQESAGGGWGYASPAMHYTNLPDSGPNQLNSYFRELAAQSALNRQPGVPQSWDTRYNDPLAAFMVR
jgi:hypothetical protein